MISRHVAVGSMLSVMCGLVAMSCGSSDEKSADNEVSAGSATGESCTKTLDCRGGLACIKNVCTATQTADEGGAGKPVNIGQQCTSTDECGAGLRCVIIATSGGKGGVCDLEAFGIKPTGKACGGECATAADCCHLPPSVSVNAADAGGTVQTCGDILQYALGGSDAICDSAVPSYEAAQACFAYRTYCAACTTRTWACNSNVCTYTGGCTPPTTINEWRACPQSTTSGRIISAVCQLTAAGATTGTCSAGTAACANDGECVGKRTFDTNVKCFGSDCACQASKCTFRCSKNADCRGGYECSDTSKTCTRAACTTDEQCKTAKGTTSAVCKSGACKIPCTNDHECSPSSGATPEIIRALGAFSGSVCSQGFCESVVGACNADKDCVASRAGVSTNAFCVTATQAPDVVSAYTN